MNRLDILDVASAAGHVDLFVAAAKAHTAAGREHEAARLASPMGRALNYMGRNEEAARYSGINSRAVVASAYVVAGLTAGISGVLLAFYTNSVSPSSHGNFFELFGIAAAVLGGCSLRGGEGSVVGIIIGAALLQVLQNLVNLLGIPSSLNFAVMGAVILVGVIADQLLSRRPATT